MPLQLSPVIVRGINRHVAELLDASREKKRRASIEKRQRLLQNSRAIHASHLSVNDFR